MTTYTIQVFNQSGFNKAYAIFMQPPIVASTGGSTPVHTNAWTTFPSITNNAWDSVTFDANIYASWGTTSEQLAPGTIVDSGGVMPVSVQTQDEASFTNTGTTGFTGVVGGKAPTGSYAIAAGTDFTSQNGFVFGMAKANGSPIPVAVATFAAEPNTIACVTPVAQFYVTDGAYSLGEVIDLSLASAQSATIDFTGKPQTRATVIQNANGSYTIDYSS